MIATTGRIWEAASKDQARPLLMGVYFDAKKRTLTATDSYVLVRVPCEVEDGDESGIIPAEALKAANGASLKVADGKATLTLRDGERTWNLLQGTWPNADEILAGAKTGNRPFAVNPALLAQVGRALSDDGKVAGLTLNPVAPLKPIRVANGRSDVEALVMPVRTSATEWPGDPADVLADDEKLIEAVKAAAGELVNRRGKKRAAEAFRKALAA